MNRIALTVAVLGLGGLGALPSPVFAQADAAARPLTEEQQDHAIETFRLLASALQSDKVSNEIKSVLMGCIYSNPLGNISEAVDKVIAANSGKIDRSKPDEVLGIMAGVCGYRPQGAGEAPAQKAAPAATPDKGR
jgi:hypothetical protein